MVEDIIQKNLIEDSTLGPYVDGRIYPKELATVKNPAYPCVCFIIEGGSYDRNIPYADQTIRFWVISNESYNIDEKIYGYIKDVLHATRFTDDDCNVVFYKDGEPSHYFEASGLGLYYITGTYSAPTIYT